MPTIGTNSLHWIFWRTLIFPATFCIRRIHNRSPSIKTPILITIRGIIIIANTAIANTIYLVIVIQILRHPHLAFYSNSLIRLAISSILKWTNIQMFKIISPAFFRTLVIWILIVKHNTFILQVTDTSLTIFYFRFCSITQSVLIEHVFSSGNGSCQNSSIFAILRFPFNCILFNISCKSPLRIF